MPGCKAHIKLDDDKCEEETHAYTKQNTIRWGVEMDEESDDLMADAGWLSK